MLMHATMNHQEHQTVTQSASGPGANPTTFSSGQRCTHCGFPLQQGFTFCPGCGMSLRTAECPACGQKVDPGWKACAYCGSPLGEAQEQTAHH
jgi:predicted amidophosphoribosyltransferase